MTAQPGLDLAQGAQRSALIALLVVLGRHPAYQGSGEGDEIVGERDAGSFTSKRERQATAVVIVEASRDALPLGDYGLLDRHDTIEIGDEESVRHARDVRIVRASPTLDLTELVFVNFDQRADLDEGSLIAAPDDVAGLRDDSESEDRPFGVLGAILYRRGCVVRQRCAG